MLKLENIFKGVLMTLLGLGIMGTASYMWFFTDELTDAKALGALIVGFILCMMRTKADDFISRYVNNLIDKKKGG